MKILRILAVVGLLSALTLSGQTIGALQARDKMLEGVRQFDAGRYSLAIPLFEEALRLDPQLINAEIYLATSYAKLYVPGNTSDQNQALAAWAIQEFEEVLNKEPDNSLAINGLAMTYQKSRNFTKAHEYFLRNAELYPSDAKASYHVAAIDWVMVHEKPSPMAASEAEVLVDEGMNYADNAIAIDPDDDDTMAYKNLLLREKARFVSDAEEQKKLIAEADDWFQKALDTRKKNQKQARSNAVAPVVPSPPPPPLPAPTLSPPMEIPDGALRTSTMDANLLYRTDPVYPPLALQARIQGIVLVEAIISRDGLVENARVLSGHPLLREAALKAIKQWRYRPAAVNGETKEAVTTIAVGFKLP
jgi:TonB family protein